MNKFNDDISQTIDRLRPLRNDITETSETDKIKGIDELMNIQRLVNSMMKRYR